MLVFFPSFSHSHIASFEESCKACMHFMLAYDVVSITVTTFISVNPRSRAIRAFGNICFLVRGLRRKRFKAEKNIFEGNMIFL